MKIVLGVNNLEHGRALIRFVRRLDFSNAEFHLVWVLAPLTISPWDLSGSTATVYDSELRTNEELLVRKDLTQLTEELTQNNLKAKYAITSGSATRELIEYSDREGADLIVIGAFHHTAVGGIFFGGVTRGVVVSAKTSVLIVKLPRENSHPLHAVYATDLSDYGARCLVELRHLKPRGIEHLTVLNVYPQQKIDRLARAVPDSVEEFKNHLLDNLISETKKTTDDLTPLGGTRQAVVKIGEVNEVINTTLAETHSELLILGAQGHGWFERGALGSISFHHALHEPHSVLIIRL